MPLPDDIEQLLRALPWSEHHRYRTPYGEHHHASTPIEAPHDQDIWLIWRHHKQALKDLGYNVRRDDTNSTWRLTREHNPRRQHDPATRAHLDQNYLDTLPWRERGRTHHREYGDTELHQTPLDALDGDAAPFWSLWRERKNELTAAGYRVSKHAERWWLERYTRLSNETRAQDAQDLERSRAHYAEIDLPVPDGLELLPYQRAGIRYALTRSRTLFADQMGLGKTIQALITISASDGLPAIVIAPASLKINWARETKTWLPSAYPVLLDGRPKSSTIEALKTRTPDKALRKHISVFDAPTKDPTELLTALEHPQRLLIINYDVLEAWLPYLTTQAPHLKSACLDELHYAKERRAKRTKAARKLVAPIPRVLGMTGTPILNRPKELLAQLEILV